MDDASGSAADLQRRDGDVRTLLAMVDGRSLSADQFHTACTVLFGAQAPALELSALIAAVDEGRRSMAELITALTVPDEFSWTADRVVIWIQDDEARAAVNLREGRSMQVALTKQGLTAERYDGDSEAPVATLRRTFDELLPAPG